MNLVQIALRRPLTMLVLVVALALPAWTHPDRLLAEEDSAEYAQLARNLAGGHGFSQAAQPPYEPDVRRTPVYPAVLAAVTCAGLLSALLGDGVWDVASWLTLSVPVAAVAWFALRR